MEVRQLTHTIDAHGMHYRELNTQLRDAVNTLHTDYIEIHNVSGQRYLGTDLHQPVEIQSTARQGMIWHPLWTDPVSSSMGMPRMDAVTP